MTKDISVSKVLRRSVSQRISWKSFNSLINQLESRNPVSNNEYVSSLLSLEVFGSTKLGNKEFNDYRITLVLHLSLSSISQLTKFWKNLTAINPLSQITYLKKLDILLSQEFGSIDIDILTNLIGVNLKEYTFTIFSSFQQDLSNNSKPTKDQHLLIHHVIFFIGHLIDNFYSKDNTLQEFIIKLLKILKKLKFQKLLQFLYKKSENILSEEKLNKIITEENPGNTLKSHGSIASANPIDTNAHSSTTTSLAYKSLAPSNLSPGLFSGYQEMKQFLWFSKVMKDFRFDNNEIILNNFIANFGSKKSHFNIALDLIQCCFRGFSYSIANKDYSYILFNWKNFIVSRLPPIISSLKLSSGAKDESLEMAVELAFNSLDENTINCLSSLQIGSAKSYDLRHSFLKTCIFNKLVQPSIFQKLFPAEFKLVQQSINQEFNKFNQELNLQQCFNDNLLNVNTEFTSLEESGLINFISKLPSLLEYSYEKQLELSKIINNIVDDLINYQDQEKLNRLFLSLFCNVQLVNLVVFNSNPLVILKKLIDYTDKDCFKLEDDDDERFQDIYSYFGVSLLGITLIIEIFKIDFSKLNVQNSFTISYLNEFYYRLCDNLTNSLISNNENSAGVIDLTNSNEETIMITNFNNLMSDWINALFDESNDGLSDDLIKSINIKQIYKLIPLIYQQSIIATKSNIINFEILSNGIDYLSQVFLVPCTLSIIQWILNKISVQKDITDTLYLDILHSIIKSNYGGELNDEDDDDEEELNIINTGDDNNEKRTVQEIPQIIFKIVINICGSNILNTVKRFPEWQGSKAIKQIVKMVNTQIDPNYIEKSIRVNHDFDINQGIRIYLSSFIKPETNAEKTTNEIAQFSFIQNYLIQKHNPDQFLTFLIDETLKYQETNNDQSRLVIILSCFLMVLTSVDSAEDKKHWRNVFTSRNIEEGQDFKSAGDQKFPPSFKLSIDHHYASIFNNSEPSDEPDVRIKNDEDDDMLDEDDLFNEKPLNITNYSRALTSDTLDSISNHVHIHDTALGHFDRLKKIKVDDLHLVKCFKILSESILDEMNNLYI